MNVGIFSRIGRNLGSGSFTRKNGQFRLTLTNDGCLHIQGSGVLAQDETVSCHGNAGDGWDSHYDADYSYTDWPWYRFADKVTRLIISPGITEIGEDAFRGYSKLEALEIGIIREVQGTFSFSPDLSLFRKAVALLYPGVHVK